MIGGVGLEAMDISRPTGRLIEVCMGLAYCLALSMTLYITMSSHPLEVPQC